MSSSPPSRTFVILKRPSVVPHGFLVAIDFVIPHGFVVPEGNLLFHQARKIVQAESRCHGARCA